MTLTEEQIKEINDNLKDSWNQGIYTEPWGIDQNEKRQVIYQRIETSGSSGGNCWGDDSKFYTNDTTYEMNNWEALDSTLEILVPGITYLQYKRLMSNIIKDNEYTQYEYYGNYENYFIRWVAVEDLINYIETNNIK